MKLLPEVLLTILIGVLSEAGSSENFGSPYRTPSKTADRTLDCGIVESAHFNTDLWFLKSQLNIIELVTRPGLKLRDRSGRKESTTRKRESRTQRNVERPTDGV